MRAENKLKLEKDRIDIASGEEKRVVEEIVIVLQSDFRELGRIPSQVRGNALARLPVQVVGESRILCVIVIAANSHDPTFFESPKHLRIKAPVVKCFRDREGFLHSASGFEPSIHEFGLPFDK